MAIELIIVDIQSGLKNECTMEKCLSVGMDIREKQRSNLIMHNCCGIGPPVT